MQRYDPPRDIDWNYLPMRVDIAGQYVLHSDAQATIARLTAERDQARAEAAAAHEKIAREAENRAWSVGLAGHEIRALATEPGTTALAEIVKKAVDAETRSCAEVALRIGPVLSDSPYLDGMQACASQARAAILARIDQRKEGV